jgi:hypothetical protein
MRIGSKGRNLVEHGIAEHVLHPFAGGVVAEPQSNRALQNWWPPLQAARPEGLASVKRGG